MAKEYQKNSMFIEQNPSSTMGVLENGDFRKNVDDDGRPRRTGTHTYISRHVLFLVGFRILCLLANPLLHVFLFV